MTDKLVTQPDREERTRLGQWLRAQESALLFRASVEEAQPDGRGPDQPPALAATPACLDGLQRALEVQRTEGAARLYDRLGTDATAVHRGLAAVTRAAGALLAEQGEKRAGSLQRLLQREVLTLELAWAEEVLRRRPGETSASHPLNTIFEQAADPMVVVSVSTGRLLAHNQAAAQTSGYTDDQLATLTLSDLQPALDRAERLRLLERLRAQRDVYYDDAPLRRADGRQIEISVHASLMRYGGEEAILAVVRDMSLVREQEARLEAHAEALQQELATQTQGQEQLRRFFEGVIDALPQRLMVLDENLTVIHANPAYYQPRGVTREQVIGQPVEEVFPHELLEEAGLRRALEGTLSTGERVWWTGFREQSAGHPERIVNIRVDPCRGPEGRRSLLVSIEDVSERYRQVYERTLLHEVSQVMLSTLDLPRLLHAILTGITAGGAVGLGFNRAVLMLVDEEAGVLQAEMAVGPENVNAAYAVWSEISGRYRTLRDFLQDYDRLPPPQERPLHELVDQLVVPLTDTDHLPMRALGERETVHVMDATSDPRVNPRFAALLSSSEFVVAPLLVGERRIGVAVADNFITHKAIRGSDVHLLSSLANLAALAVDRAQLFQESQDRAEELAHALGNLQSAEQGLLRAERLATIGQVTDAVAHEIRNPLSTIGGFARSILRDPKDLGRTERAAEIIVEESDRLEELLRGLLDFSRPESLQLQPVSLATVVEGTLELTAAERKMAGVETRVEIPPDLPPVALDPSQFRQVLFNLVRNALEAMPRGGTLTVSAQLTARGVELSIADTGAGIPADDLDRIFDSFFTTKPTGTGLGLAITRKILDAHHAQVEAHSEPGHGSRFTILLPHPKQPD